MSDALVVGISTGVAVPILLPILNHWLQKKKKINDDILSELKEMGIKIEATAEGTKAILRYRLIKNMSYDIHMGHTSFKHKEEIVLMYNAYKSLGGNSVVDDLFLQFKKLEIKDK